MTVSTLEFNLRPGHGLGMFEIGMSLWNVIDILRYNTTLFPRVEIKYDATADGALSPVILHINPHLDLLFTGYHQRLRTIALRRLSDPNPPILLTYKDGTLFSATSTNSAAPVLRRSDVSRYFGPTYPGDGLQYPGVSFLFDEDSSAINGLGGQESLKSTIAMSSLSGDGRHREVKRVVVSQTALNGVESDTLDEIDECELMAGSICRAIIKVHDGVLLHFYPTSSKPVHVRIGVTNAQDLTCDLGSPLRTYYKEDDRMAIHSFNKALEGADEGYFFNYFQFGMDFLLSSSTHVVQKIIMHTNIPGTLAFQRYQRCPWEIQGQPEDEEDDTPPSVKFSEKFDVISRFLSGSSREPLPSMQLDRTEDERVTLPSSITRLVGFDGIILEVTERAQVVTVALF